MLGACPKALTRQPMRTHERPDSPAANRPSVQRMLRIHQALQSGRSQCLDLAGELEVSAKTIHRDLEFMRDRLELPLEYDAQQLAISTPGSQRLPHPADHRGRTLCPARRRKSAPAISRHQLRKTAPQRHSEDGPSLPDTVSLNLEDIEQTISFRTSAEPILNLEIFDALAKATAQRQQLRSPIANRVSPEPRRLIDPYHLANINGEWFLFAFDHLRGDIRTFVPARMREVKRNGKTFFRPRSFPWKSAARKFRRHSAEGEYDVLIRFSSRVADYIREKKWHDSQRLSETRTGEVELRMKLSSLQEVERWVLSWAGDAVALEPKELVDSVRRAAQRLLQSADT